MNNLFVLKDNPVIQIGSDGSEVCVLQLRHRGSFFLCSCKGSDKDYVSNYLRQYDIITLDDITDKAFDFEAFRALSEYRERENIDYPIMFCENVVGVCVHDDIPVKA